jgi:hypothetical protein
VAKDIGIETQRALKYVQPTVEQDRTGIGTGKVTQHHFVGVFQLKEHFHKFVLLVLLTPRRAGFS